MLINVVLFSINLHHFGSYQLIQGQSHAWKPGFRNSRPNASNTDHSLLKGLPFSQCVLKFSVFISNIVSLGF